MCVICVQSGCDSGLCSATQMGLRDGAGQSTGNAAKQGASLQDLATYMLSGFNAEVEGIRGATILPRQADGSLLYNMDDLTAEVRVLAEWALQSWSDVSGITFRAVPRAEAQFTFGFEPGFGGVFMPVILRYDNGTAAYQSGRIEVGEGLYTDPPIEFASGGYSVLVHEIGHALGLNHPGTYNFGEVSIQQGLRFDNDSIFATIMSYVDEPGDPEVITPQFADILAVQELYGAPVSTRPLDTIYGVGTELDGPLAELGEIGFFAAVTLFDSGGSDLIDLSADRFAMQLDLTPGTYSTIRGTEKMLAIAPGTLIENASGGRGDDTFTGNAAANILRGNGGDDTFFGGGGDDTIEGGDGQGDRAGYTGIQGNYRISLSGDQIIVSDKRSGDQGRDTLRDVEGLTFGAEGELDLTLLQGVASLGADALTVFVEMYIAYFDRAPDSEGLFYWGTRLAEGMTLPEIAASFFEQDETRAVFPDSGNSAALVDAAYRNVLEREADAEGRAYWIAKLDNDDGDRGAFMLDVINGAKANAEAADDVRTITQKADLGIYYAIINGLNDVENARSVMAAYDRADPDRSLAAAADQIDVFAFSAGQSGSTERIVDLVGVIDDPFAFA